MERREFLETAAGLASLATFSGCTGDQAPRITQAVERTESALERLPWDSYQFSMKNIRLEKENAGETGIGNANFYNVKFRSRMEGNDANFRDWFSSQEFAEEFYNFLEEPGYDIMTTLNSNLKQFHPENLPRSRDQIYQYEIRINGNNCNYILDRVQAGEMKELTKSQERYGRYLQGENAFEEYLDEGGFFC